MKLLLIQDTIENCIKCQKGWLYLEPIFSSEDIKKKMPAEKAKFESVDKSFKFLMEQFAKDTFIWENIENDKQKIEFE